MSTISIRLLWSMSLVSLNIHINSFLRLQLQFIFTMKSIGQSLERKLVCPFMIVQRTAVVYSVQHGFPVKASSSPT